MLLVSTCIILANTQVLLYVTLKVLIYGISRTRTSNGWVAGGGISIMKMAYADGYAYNQATQTWSPVAPNLGTWIQPLNWPNYGSSRYGYQYPRDANLWAAPWFVTCLEGCFLSERGYSLTGGGVNYDPASGGFIIHLTLGNTQNGDGTYRANHRATDWLYYENHLGGKGSGTQTGKLLPLVLLPKDAYIIDADGDIINKK